MFFVTQNIYLTFLFSFNSLHFYFSFNSKPSLPKIPGGLTTGNNNRINSGRSSASSAKQVYMSKARYISGILLVTIVHIFMSHF